MQTRSKKRDFEYTIQLSVGQGATLLDTSPVAQGAAPATSGWVWCGLVGSLIALVAAIAFGVVEYVSASQAKMHLFELALSNQVYGDLCLPLDFTTSTMWKPQVSTNGAFHTHLDGKQTGLEQLFGPVAISSANVQSAAMQRNISLDPAYAFENFETLQSMNEFRLETRYPNGIWGQFYNVLSKCSGIFSTGNVIFTSLLNATSSIMNREQETKENSIPGYIWNDKVTLPPDYSCPSIYSNIPRTLLNYANSSNQCLRDRFKHAYVEGLYKPPHTPSALASTINDVVFDVLTSDPHTDLPDGQIPPGQPKEFRFDDPREGCPPELRGVLCPLFLAYMRATVTTHAGAAQVGDRQLELASAMLTWIYQGFHLDLFSKNATAQQMTIQAAETLFCFYAEAAREGLAADDVSAIQVRWLKAVAAKGDLLLSDVFDFDSVATESVHNSLALGFQGAVASAHIVKDLWNEQQKGTLKPGDLACDADLRRKFVRESLRHSSPGVPVMFSNTVSGSHTLLSGSGEKQVSFEGGTGHIDLVSHFIPARHSIEFANSKEFDMERAELQCPFLKRQTQYKQDLKVGGCGEDVTQMDGYSDSNVVFGTTGDVDPNTHHSFCGVEESNVVVNSGSSDDDFQYWFTSNTAYSPFGYGYRRCPGEALMWRVLDDFVRRLDHNYDVKLTHPFRDSTPERWGLATVPSNGLRVRLHEASRPQCA